MVCEDIEMSDAPPDWLPPPLDHFTWPDTLDELFEVFKTDFINGKPRFNGKPIWWDQKCEDDHRPEGFWHITTREDRKSGDRLSDPPRAKRMSWCRAVIDNPGPPDVLMFDYEEGNGKIRTYLWLHEYDYVVILGKTMRRGQQRAYFLITAFCIDGSYTKRKMQKKYDEREK